MAEPPTLSQNVVGVLMDNNFVPLAFPVSGIDNSGEYSSQRVNTAQEARNVRSFDAICHNRSMVRS